MNKLNKPFIPNGEMEYVEEIKVQDGDNVRTLKMNVPKKSDIPFQSEMWDIIDTFENDSWAEGREGLDTGWKSLNDAFGGGIKPGFIIVPADSNVGKTIFLSQLLYQVAHKNNNVYVMDFSLDDPMDDKIPRVVASDSKVPINIIKNPRSHVEHEAVLARRANGLNKLRQSIDKYRIYDSTFTSNIEDIEKEILRVKEQLSSIGRHNVQLVVGIDNFHDLAMRGVRSEDKFNVLAQACADLAIRYNLVLVCSAELRKINGHLRPSLDAIRDSVKIKYEAKAILLCHNDVHYNGEGANVFFERSDKPGKQPVLEIHFAKNKMGSFKGRLYFEQYPELSRLEEADEESTKRYASSVYS